MYHESNPFHRSHRSGPPTPPLAPRQCQDPTSHLQSSPWSHPVWPFWPHPPLHTAALQLPNNFMHPLPFWPPQGLELPASRLPALEYLDTRPPQHPVSSNLQSPPQNPPVLPPYPRPFETFPNWIQTFSSPFSVPFIPCCFLSLLPRCHPIHPFIPLHPNIVPRESFPDFLDVWLLWVIGGSHRWLLEWNHLHVCWSCWSISAFSTLSCLFFSTHCSATTQMHYSDLLYVLLFLCRTCQSVSCQTSILLLPLQQ